MKPNLVLILLLDLFFFLFFVIYLSFHSVSVLGKNASVCTCRPDSVEIDMRPFMEAFRPEEFKEWSQYWYGERVVTEKSNGLKRMFSPT